MNSLGKVFAQIFQALGFTPPPWMLPIAFAIVIALLWPLIQRNQATSKARGLYRKSMQEQGDARDDLQAEALDLVKDNPNGCVALAEEGILKGDKDFARLALDQLKATGKQLFQVRRLTLEIDGDKPKIPEAEILAITRFLDEGLTLKARERLAVALEQWPDNAELLDLRNRLGET